MAEHGRLKGFFFAYFAYVGIFSPYLSLYLADGGFSVVQIGLLMSLPQWMRIIAPPFWGWLADSGGRPDRLMRLSSVLTLAAVLVLPLASGSGLLATGALLALLFFVSAAQVPIGEARTLVATQGDPGAYGRIRLWGSIGFIGGVALVGPLLDSLGTATLPIWMGLALLLLTVIVWPASAPAPVSSVPEVVTRLRDRLREVRVVAFFVANFLMIFAHASYYVLYSLFLEQHGYSKASIGAFWTIGVVAEVVLFRWQQVLFVRFAAMSLLAFSIGLAAIRFTMIGSSDGSLWILLSAQLLHAFTFGLHHSAVMKVLHQWFGAKQQAQAQALYVTLAYGLGGALGGLFVSALWAQVSPAAAFYGAAAASLIGLVTMVFCLRPAVRPQ